MNNNIGQKYLPIGTVVMLKGGSKRLMITGFCSMPTDDENEMYDYAGCMYPEGFLSSDQTALFNHDQIERIYYMGFIDDEEKAFKQSLNALVNQVSNQNANTSQVVPNNTNNNQTEQIDIASIPPVGPGLPGYVAPQQPVNNTPNPTPVQPNVNNNPFMNQNMQINQQPMSPQMTNMQFDNNNNINA